jgi:hypothetical protein
LLPAPTSDRRAQAASTRANNRQFAVAVGALAEFYQGASAK